MDFEQYKVYIKNIEVGKQLPDSVYVHESAASALPEELSLVLQKIASALKIPSTDWNILKLYKRDFKIAFLSYPDFETHSYPALKHSYTVDLSKNAKEHWFNSFFEPLRHSVKHKEVHMQKYKGIHHATLRFSRYFEPVIHREGTNHLTDKRQMNFTMTTLPGIF